MSPDAARQASEQTVGNNSPIHALSSSYLPANKACRRVLGTGENIPS